MSEEIAELCESKELLIKSAEITDPYYAVLSVARKHSRDVELRSIMENHLAAWLDDNKDLYADLKTIKKQKIHKDAIGYIVENDVMQLEKQLFIIKDEISKYITNEHFITNDEKGNAGKIIYCAKTDPHYEVFMLAMSENSLYGYVDTSFISSYLTKYVNNHVFMTCYEKTVNYNKYRVDFFPELTKIIELACMHIARILEIKGETLLLHLVSDSDDIYCDNDANDRENQLYLTFDLYEAGVKTEYNDFNANVWKYLKHFHICKTDSRGVIRIL
jgi:hypothetical protein